MEIKHGIGVREKATSLQQIATVNADVPVVIGIAPVHLATDPVAANVPVYCNDIGDGIFSVLILINRWASVIEALKASRSSSFTINTPSS